MSRFNSAVFLAATIFGFAAAPIAHADIADYEFQLVSQTVTRTETVTIDVRLVNRATGKPVNGAIVFATRLDMQPDGMETMTTPLDAIPATEAGLYRFNASLAMAGGWRLSLAAKVQGEEGTVQSRLVFQAVDQ